MKLERFDYQIGNKRKKNTFIILGLVCLGAFITVILYRTFASYKVTNSYNIIGGKVANFAIDGVTMYLVAEDGTETKTSIIPKENEYVYDAERSNCTNGTEIIYSKENHTITVDETAGDTCNVYFNYIPLAKQTLYALGYTDSDIKTGIPYGPDGTGEDGFYITEDNYGTSYYYYSENDLPPFVGFADINFNIIRINGDGSLRLMAYDTYETFKFNLESNDNAYLGYKYGKIGSDNYLSTHSNSTDSNLKSFIANIWWTNVFEQYSSMISDAYFCNDRSLYKEEYGEKEAGDTALGTGTNTTYYGAYYRLRNNTPSLMCAKNDAFTVTESDIGNGQGNIPVGMITADEAYMTNYLYWPDHPNTMTPAMFKDNVAYTYAYTDGFIYQSVSENNFVYPVVNLRYGLTYTGDSSWFEVSE